MRRIHFEFALVVWCTRHMTYEENCGTWCVARWRLFIIFCYLRATRAPRRMQKSSSARVWRHGFYISVATISSEERWKTRALAWTSFLSDGQNGISSDGTSCCWLCRLWWRLVSPKVMRRFMSELYNQKGNHLIFTAKGKLFAGVGVYQQRPQIFRAIAWEEHWNGLRFAFLDLSHIFAKYNSRIY